MLLDGFLSCSIQQQQAKLSQMLADTIYYMTISKTGSSQSTSCTTDTPVCYAKVQHEQTVNFRSLITYNSNVTVT
jgi:hypothetical protein